MRRSFISPNGATASIRIATVFTENIETLRRLHSKWLFVQAARGHGLAVPPTVLLTSPDDAGRALASGRDLVLKPVYSRFASRTIVGLGRRPTFRPMLANIGRGSLRISSLAGRSAPTASPTPAD